MIRRLRWKFVAINMALVLAILVALCAVLMATTQDSLRRDSLTALDQAVTLTATSTQEGYGLGLAIATELAKLHHGKVWAQSDDTGNTFFFSLPRAKEERGGAGTGLPARSSGQEQPFSQY